MDVLHLGCQRGGRFYMWGETTRKALGDRDGAEVSSEVPTHPFGVDVWGLWNLFEETAPGWMLGRGRDRMARLVLPSTETAPGPSPTLAARGANDGGETTELRAWRVPVLTVPGGAAVDWLRGDWPELKDVAFGSEWEVWRRAAQLAANLVEVGQLVPTLESVEAAGGVARARWQPLPTRDAVLAELHRLEAALPESVRADASFRDDAPPNTDANTFHPPSTGELLERGLTSLADGLARSRLSARDLPTRSGSRRGDQPARNAWLSGLVGANPVVSAPEDALENLREKLDDWTRDLERLQRRRVRLHFRLHPPQVPDDSEAAAQTVPVDAPWRLEFLLQSITEPSLVVDAETVWSAADRAREILDTRLDRPRERLLEELARAETLYPALGRALDEQTPTDLELSVEEAFEFLDEYAELLDRSGFSLRIPDWWEEADHRLGARLQADTTGSGELGLQALCRFDWEVALGDETLTREQLEQLAQLKQPLVRHNGEWVALEGDDIASALELLERPAASEMQAGEALRTTLGLEETELPVVDAEFDGWLGDLFDEAGDGGVEPRPTPENFDGRLRPYQRRGLGWLRYLERRGLGGCLADDMGLGKTIQVLARMAEERLETDTAPGPTLAVVPLSVVGNWRRETERFVPSLDVAVHHGPDRPSGDAIADKLTEADLVVTTYGVVRSDIDQLAGIRWHRVVLDEAQKVKNSAASRTQAVRRLQADRRMALTGTPVENRLTELWSIMEFLNPGMLGPEKQFREEIAEPVEAGDATQTELLRRLTRPFILRRLKTDERIIDDLPDKTEIKEYCHLTEEQVTLYRAAVDETMTRIAEAEGMDRRGAILKLMNQLKQICNHPAQFLDDDRERRLEGRSGKLARLKELAAELEAAGDKALIFTQYTSMGRLIRRHLQHHLGRRVLYLHGQTDQQARDRMVDRFQDPEGPPLFLLSLRAGGTGLTLTAASHVIHYDRWWNPAVEDQATDRAFRIGQTDDVQVRKLVCEGTFEERIDEMIDRKRQLAERVLSEGETFLTEMSTDELREVVRLSDRELS